MANDDNSCSKLSDWQAATDEVTSNVTLVDTISGEDFKQVKVLECGDKKTPKMLSQWNKAAAVVEQNESSHEEDKETHDSNAVPRDGKEENALPLLLSSLSLTLAKTTVIARPQTKFADCIDNSKTPFRPKLVFKHHAQVSWPPTNVCSGDSTDWPCDVADDSDDESDRYVHPYKYELDHFVPLEHLFKPRVAIKPTFRSEDTPLTMIDTVEELKNLCEHLNMQTEFAVDLEANSERSYQGITCLVQISTRNEDYIIDPFPLWSHMHLLNEPFTDPNIVKVFHGASSDVVWLQRDFGVYVVNMFDTYEALRVLDRRPRSLSHLVSSYMGVSLDKKYSRADWRIRPLPDELVKYAREDTHYLLYCYDQLSIDLLNAENAEKKLLRLVFERSRDVCLLTYTKRVVTVKSADSLCRKLSVKLNHRQRQALRWLYLWRDETARTHDESPQYVLPHYLMIRLAELLPREPSSVLVVAKPAPPLLKLHVLTVSRILDTARNLPDVQEKSDESLGDQCEAYQLWEAQTSFPHDFSHTAIDEELISDEANRTFEIPSSSSLRCADSSALCFNQKQTQFKARCVSAGKKKMFARWLSPYGAYKRAIATMPVLSLKTPEELKLYWSSKSNKQKQVYPEVIKLKTPSKPEAPKDEGAEQSGSVEKRQPFPKGGRGAKYKWTKAQREYKPYDYARHAKSQYRWINPALKAKEAASAESAQTSAASSSGNVQQDRNDVKQQSEGASNAKERRYRRSGPGRKKKTSDDRSVTYVPKREN
ncbi:hypothetical protein M513_04160 [Trichuris suis]|uniref:HRDC domain-containing protein n=1 Tax=Trichuris suis TaxID=68888 RepID=A0A085MCN2_9BILA|nr:hypothetical protein M513_04160 [Trichuris suis]